MKKLLAIGMTAMCLWGFSGDVSADSPATPDLWLV